MECDFSTFFATAMGSGIKPYPYQLKLSKEQWPEIIKIQTGLGKTASIILTWLFKRLQNDPSTPRRLVYCLPMRVLVEQTAENANRWLTNLIASGLLPPNSKPSVYVLMGGEIDKDWDRYPEGESILIGTQDLLLSRALNRGYAMSRFRWPINFGLLNNDCLWVMDEIQLMGSGLATTTQLQSFREAMGIIKPCRSIWMSATMQKEWLNTVDFRPYTGKLQEITLSEEDQAQEAVRKRIEAKKVVKKAVCPWDNPKKIADTILEAHRKGSRTLVVVNTVKRAKDIYAEMKKLKPNASLILVHSRFRANDRKVALDKLLGPLGKNGSICLATQVVEAGVDISATTLFTDLAPWASLIQRFGRCNRYGEDSKAKVYWFDVDYNKKGAAAPYTEEKLQGAREVIFKLTNAAPKALPTVPLKFEHTQVIRSKDVSDLFDTTPDLAGLDLDISRFIREQDEHDVYIFWRNFVGDNPDNVEPAPTRNELCPVPVSEARQSKFDFWRWDHLDKRWMRSSNITPGMVLMTHWESGGYSSEMGWTGEKEDKPEFLDLSLNIEEGDDDDQYASVGRQSLSEHTLLVRRELENILSSCAPIESSLVEMLLQAAIWHDFGKSHEVFQKAMGNNSPGGTILAKTDLGRITYERRGFRHELASALAALENGLPDLVAYLVAAHHGKVRLSIRSLHHEKKPQDPAIRFARGIWEGDILPEVQLGGGRILPRTLLDLSWMEFGEGLKGASWLERMLHLRDQEKIGVFRLAYLEALLRAADWRASQKVGD